jgi:hypothetical protein
MWVRQVTYPQNTLLPLDIRKSPAFCWKVLMTPNQRFMTSAHQLFWVKKFVGDVASSGPVILMPELKLVVVRDQSYKDLYTHHLRHGLRNQLLTISNSQPCRTLKQLKLQNCGGSGSYHCGLIVWAANVCSGGDC